MKNTITAKLLYLFILFWIVSIVPAVAQNGDPPPPPSEHGQNGNQVPGGGAPIGGGSVILLVLGSAYGAKKIYVAQRNLRES